MAGVEGPKKSEKSESSDELVDNCVTFMMALELDFLDPILENLLDILTHVVAGSNVLVNDICDFAK